MVAAGREGRSAGAGFFEYGEDGKRTQVWPGLTEMFPPAEEQLDVTEIQERMLFREAIETVKCFDEGVLRSVPEANIGSIFGIGFPAWTGGVIQYIDGYEGGVTGFVGRCKELADTYGERFTPPASLVAKAESGEPLSPAPF
jgi:3-hydroxyacyl-CoA dehydrogenase/enoyl-CoA hydratase/3-hydroxybutyryl-CoA epimerase